MHIGLTYDLRAEYLAAGYGEEQTAEFDRPDTIEAIQEALRALGHQPDPIGNARRLVERLACGDRWDLVFNIAEGFSGIGREAQVPAILDLYQIPYTFSDPLVMALSLHKGMAKAVVRDAGIPTPDFALVHRLEDLQQTRLPFPLFAKPVAEGTGKGIGPWSRVEDPAGLRRACQRLLGRYQQPVLLETFLPGREFTVGIWGTGPEAEVLGTLEIVLGPGAEPDAYSYFNKERCEQLVQYRLVSAASDPEVHRAEQIALAVWRLLGCRDAGRVDLRADAHGQPQFLEVNPLAGLHPTHSDLPILCSALGIAYLKLIERIVQSAARRARPRLRPEPAAAASG
ncbi:MAG: D-alanine--D-alanine ligase family protein [Thermoguttaceae bacterium]